MLLTPTHLSKIKGKYTIYSVLNQYIFRNKLNVSRSQNFSTFFYPSQGPEKNFLVHDIAVKGYPVCDHLFKPASNEMEFGFLVWS